MRNQNVVTLNARVSLQDKRTLEQMVVTGEALNLSDALRITIRSHRQRAIQCSTA